MSAVPRKICVFSGKRGGFGAFLPLMKLINQDEDLELQILLGDMHTSSKFGFTADEVKNFFPHATAELIKMESDEGDQRVVRAKNLGACLIKAAAILHRLNPDIVLVHADRGEHLMVALAALNLNIPVAHTQGGEVSGNIDDVQRNAITKLAHVHFPETETAASRIKQLGEESWRIHVTGSTYIDRIIKNYYTPASEARKKYGLGENEEFFIIIFHSDTYLSIEENYHQMKIILESVAQTGHRSIVLYPCSDPGHEEIIRAIKEVENDKRYIIHKNIDNLDFLGLMSTAKAIIGNSSCALVEAPYFRLPAINIGQRQQGREREENVIDAKPLAEDIKKKIEHVFSSEKFKEGLANCGWRLGNGTAAEKIINVLRNLDINDKLLRKNLVHDHE